MRKTNSLLRYSYFNEAFIAQQISRRSQRFQQNQCKSQKKCGRSFRRKWEERQEEIRWPHRMWVFVCEWFGCFGGAALENAFASAATKNILPKRDAKVPSLPEYWMTDWENDNLSVFMLCAARSSVAYSFKDPSEPLKLPLSGQKVSNRSNMVAMTGATITIFISANYDHWPFWSIRILYRSIVRLPFGGIHFINRHYRFHRLPSPPMVIVNSYYLLETRLG